jgi:hypothetical protein
MMLLLLLTLTVSVTPPPFPCTHTQVVIAYLTNPLWLGGLLLNVAGGAAMVGSY